MRKSLAALAGVVAAASGLAVMLRNGDSPERCQRAGDRGCLLPPAPCEEIGLRDLNPDDDPVAPRLGTRLLPRRSDGRLPFGFNDVAYLAEQASIAEDLALHRGVGSTLWRLPFDWRTAETRPGELDFTHWDAVYCAGLAQGVRPIFTIAAAPSWAADKTIPCPSANCIRPPSPEHYGALRRIAELIAIRYPEAAAVEAWNEPNLHKFWGRPDPAGYAAVLREIYLGAKNGNPALPVLGGALSNQMTGDPVSGDRAMLEFLSALYRSGGGGYMDALSVHAYPVQPLDDPPVEVDRTMEGAREVVAELDRQGRRIWVTEVGVAAAPTRADRRGTRSLEEQADALLEIYRRFERDPEVDAVLFHTLVDPNARVGSSPGYGWTTPVEGGFQAKPVYCAFSRELGGGGCRVPLVPTG